MSKRFIASVTLSAFGFMAVPVAALPGSSSSSLLASSGRVLSQQGEGWNEGIQDIAVGTRIRTSKGSAAVVALPGGSSLRLAANTQVAFNTLEDGNVVVQLERGRVIGHAGSAVKIQTDRTATTASVGEFVVNTSNDGTQLDVVSGDAKLSALDGEKVSFGSEGDVDSDTASSVGMQKTQVHHGKMVAQNNDDDDDNEGGDGDAGGDGDDDNGALKAGLIGGGALAIILAIALSGSDDDDPAPSPSNS